MKITEVDERDVNVELDSAAYRVHDILSEDKSGAAIVKVYEVTNASLEELLAWVASARTPCPVRSDIYCVAAGLVAGQKAIIKLA